MFDEDFKDEEVSIPEIVSKLKEASDAYYNGSESIMSDEEFDLLKDQLKAIDPKHSFLYQIGASVEDVSSWKKEKHKIPMGSLNKCTNVKEFREWVKSVADEDGELRFDFVLTPKYDGLSLNCEYENGILKKAISRGQGEEGEDLYKNAIKIKNLPTKLRSNFTGSLRGEVLIHHDDFIKLNEILKSRGEKEVKNPRNGCALIRRYSGEHSEFLSIIFYNCVSENKKFKSLEEELKEIENMGAPVADYLICTENDVIEQYNNYEQFQRDESVYDLDGLVVMINDNREIEDLGEVYGNRKGAIAFKFGRVIKQSKVKNIRWDVGKTGKFTPVVEIESVRLLGTDVKSVNIYNMDYFDEYNLGPGDVVAVFKANDIIPKIEEVVERGSSKRFEVLSVCPICESVTEVVGKFLECSNEECQSKYLGNLNKYREVLEIDYISDKTIEKLYDSGLVKYPFDFYTMDRNRFSSIDGLGEASYDKAVQQFLAKKELELPIFIGSLNILQISTKIVEKIYNAGYDTLEKMRSVTVDELVKIKGLKEKTANKFVNGINKKKHVIDGLLKVGIALKGPVNLVHDLKSDVFNERSFCFTGSLEKMNPETNSRFKREEAWKLVRENGGRVFESVKKGLDYLVTPNTETNSSKAQKARKYGVTILSENEFWKMLG